MTRTRTRGALAIVTALAMILVFALAGGTTAQDTPGGELNFNGQLVDARGDWVADFDLWAQEAPTYAPEYFPNGGLEEGEPGEEWAAEGLFINRFGFDEPPLPDPYDGEFSLQLGDPAVDGFAMVCLGWTDPGATFDVGFAYAIDGLIDPEGGLLARVGFFDREEPCNVATPGTAMDEYDVVVGPLTSTDWTEEGFPVTVPSEHPYEFGPSLALMFHLDGVSALGAFLDNISVVGPPEQQPAGVGNMFFSIYGHALSACDTHGPSAEPGFEGILADIGCGGSGGQAVAINACAAELEAHGFVHSDAPNTTFLGQVVIDITLEVSNKKNSDFVGDLMVEIYTPKDVIALEGKIPKGSGEAFMSTCDRLPG